MIEQDFPSRCASLALSLSLARALSLSLSCAGPVVFCADRASGTPLCVAVDHGLPAGNAGFWQRLDAANGECRGERNPKRGDAVSKSK